MLTIGNRGTTEMNAEKRRRARVQGGWADRTTQKQPQRTMEQGTSLSSVYTYDQPDLKVSFSRNIIFMLFKFLLSR